MPIAFSNVFTGNPLDRASDRRGDADWIAARLSDPDALALPLWNGRLLVEAGPDAAPRLAYAPARLARDLAGAPSGEGERLLFLGLWKTTPVFALDLEDADDPSGGALKGYGAFEELRPLASALPAAEAGIAATAKAVFEWRRRHRFCSNCGVRSLVADGGWKRRCPDCRTDHFPRTDPVAIMLAVRGERCLLGRQAIWPPGMHSALAGFVEPGESLEEGCARELKEEAGLVAQAVRYHSSQPWPFPSSLMVGMIAEVAEGESAVADQELESVRWFSRAEAASLAADEPVDGCWAPPPLAIAHQLIKAWASEG